MAVGFLDAPKPIAFAHRGGSQLSENALAAFDAVHQLGFRYVETDIRTSKDGVAFIFHDADMKRMVGRDVALAELSARELGRERLVGGERIPTLDEALRRFPEMRFNLDLKDDASVESVARVLADNDALGRVCVTSFSDRRVAAARRLLGSEVCYGLGVWGVARVALSALFGGWLVDTQASVLQVPMRWHSVRLVTPSTVAKAHRLGLSIHVWTVNDRDEMERAVDLRIDGIMTDQPRLLREVLIGRGLWAGSGSTPGPEAGQAGVD